MKIAIPIWNGSVSSVLDFAQQILLVDAEGQQETGRSQVQLSQKSIQQQACLLVDMGVDVLICGAVSRPLATMLTASKIEVIPFVSGPVEEVLGAYFNKGLFEPQFLQPGCLPGDRKGFGHGRRGCRKQGEHGKKK